MSAIWSAQEAAEIFDSIAATYNRDFSYHQDDVRYFITKAAIQDTEHVLDLGTGTGWVAQMAHSHSTGRIVGVDISRKMIEEARRQSAGSEANILYLVGDMITLQGLDFVKAGVSATGYHVITCLWAFSNVAHDKRVAMLRRWQDFLTPNGRIVFEMHHPQYDLATYDLVDASGAIRQRWKFSDQQSVTECAEACKAIGAEAGLELIGELEESGTEVYEDATQALRTFLRHQDNLHPTRSQLEAAKTTFTQAMGKVFWHDHNIQGPVLLQHKSVSVVGVWRKKA
jgi:ubiquinone/menaquinone biosynthesis C-methylase UbiE